MALPVPHNPQSEIRNPQSVAGWLTAEQAGRILGRSTRTIQLWVQNRRLDGMLVDGRLMIDPAGCPELRVAGGELSSPVLAGSSLASVPVKHRQLAHQRMQLVESYLSSESDKPIGMTKGRFQALWVETYNRQQRMAGKASEQITLRTLLRYLKAYADGGIAALVDRRASNGNGSTMSPEAKDFILGLYLSENRPHIPAIYEKAEHAARRNGWMLPGLRAVQRWLAREDRKLIAAGREKKKHRDRCVPHIRRDRSAVHAMQCIIGDHHQFDFLWPRLVVNEKKRCLEWKFFRPWLTAWIDYRTWRCWGWTIAFDSPDGDRVMGSFLRGCLEHGIPEHVYLDNGKDYRMRRFAGGRSQPAAKGAIVAKRFVTPVLESLGVGVTWAIPYNAKAKNIEPWFKIVEERFGKLFSTYCGNRPANRPERLKGLKAEAYVRSLSDDETLARIMSITAGPDQTIRDRIVLEPLCQLFNGWLTDDYHRRPCPVQAAPPGASVDEAFFACRPADYQARTIDEGSAALLLMPSKPLSVRANGIWINEFGCHYWSDDLERWRCNPAKVLVRYNPDDASKVYVFDAARDTFICIAEPYLGEGIHPLAASDADRARVSDAIALQRRLAKRDRLSVRGLNRFAAGVLLDAQQQAALQAGHLRPALPGTAGPRIIKLDGALAEAAEASRRHSEARSHRPAERAQLDEYSQLQLESDAGSEPTVEDLDPMDILTRAMDGLPETDHGNPA
jgi:hypothetical protein